MNGVNFIPRQRREATARRARFRAWLVGASAYAALCAVAFTAARTIDAAADEPLVASELAQLPAQIETSRRALSSLGAQLAEAQARLDAARAVARQPDWSVLLGLLAQSLGDDIVLTNCRLDAYRPDAAPLAAPRAGARRAAGADADAGIGATGRGVGVGVGVGVGPASRFRLELSGLGRTPASVSQFVLRLEQLDLFERVTILKTGREAFGEHESIGFRLEAVIGAAAEGGAR